MTVSELIKALEQYRGHNAAEDPDVLLNDGEILNIQETNPRKLSDGSEVPQILIVSSSSLTFS